jgi:hypothetical protein
MTSLSRIAAGEPAKLNVEKSFTRILQRWSRGVCVALHGDRLIDASAH